MIAKLLHVCMKMTQSEWWVIDYEESGLLDYLYSIVFSNINNYDEFIFIHLLIFFFWNPELYTFNYGGLCFVAF